ncbi:hypothetical protein MMC28_007247 [Mycoblastus sanguinarius]|nr:hypothetical protein [Mycoblastus sanguinarius]
MTHFVHDCTLLLLCLAVFALTAPSPASIPGATPNLAALDTSSAFTDAANYTIDLVHAASSSPLLTSCLTNKLSTPVQFHLYPITDTTITLHIYYCASLPIQPNFLLTIITDTAQALTNHMSANTGSWLSAAEDPYISMPQAGVNCTFQVQSSEFANPETGLEQHVTYSVAKTVLVGLKGFLGSKTGSAVFGVEDQAWGRVGTGSIRPYAAGEGPVGIPI